MPHTPIYLKQYLYDPLIVRIYQVKMRISTKSLYTESMQQMRKNLQERKLRPILYIKKVQKSIKTSAQLPW